MSVSSPIERPAGLTRASAFGDRRPEREWLGGRVSPPLDPEILILRPLRGGGSARVLEGGL